MTTLRPRPEPSMKTLTHFRHLFLLAAVVLVLGGCRSKKAAEEPSDQTASASDAVEETAAPPAAKPFGNLTSFEPAIAGLQSGMDTTSVQAILGQPNSLTTMADLRQPGSFLLLWQYKNLIAHFSSSAELGAVEITGRGIPTARGVAVGDSLSKVLSAYGKPARADGVLYHFQDRSDIDNGDAVVFRVQDGFVTSIYIGHVYE